MDNFKEWLNEMAFRSISQDEINQVIAHIKGGETRVSKIAQNLGIDPLTVRNILAKYAEEHKAQRRPTRIPQDVINNVILAATKYYMNDSEISEIFNITRTTAKRFILPHLTPEIIEARKKRQKLIERGTIVRFSKENLPQDFNPVPREPHVPNPSKQRKQTKRPFDSWLSRRSAAQTTQEPITGPEPEIQQPQFTPRPGRWKHRPNFKWYDKGNPNPNLT